MMTGLCLIVELLARCPLIGVLVVRRRGQGAGGEGGGGDSLLRARFVVITGLLGV